MPAFRFMLALFAALCLSFWGSTGSAEECNTPPALMTIQEAIQSILNAMDGDLKAAADELRDLGMEGPPVRKILDRLCRNHRSVVDACTVDTQGVMRTVEPAPYREHEGSDISGQEQIIRLHKTRRPVLSMSFRAVEGFEAVDLEQPVFSTTGELLGSVSLLFRPEALMKALVDENVQGLPVDFWVMQPNGKILYDPDEAEIGRNLFTDPLYQAFPDLLSLGNRLVRLETGCGEYSFLGKGLEAPVRKEAAWVSVGLHDTRWRLVMTHVVAGDPAATQRKPAHTGIPTLREALEDFSTQADLLGALADEDIPGLQGLLAEFYRKTTGIYSVQWLDPQGVNRCGYPPENSLQGYVLRKKEDDVTRRFLEALDKKLPASFEGPLLEGREGQFVLVPVQDGASYFGLIYVIRLK